MCRMLIAAGEFDTSVLLDAFMRMAKGENGKHERNRNCVYDHPDGWGIARLESDRFRKYKKEVTIREDDAFDKYRGIDSNAMMLHTRRSSSTKRRYENTQPFYRKMSGTEYLFCHNGSIREDLEYDGSLYPLGDTDSEMYFYYVLTALMRGGEDSLPAALCSIEKYSAVNMILMNNEAAHLAVQYSEDPEYYTMRLYDSGRCIIISSEELPAFGEAEWRRIDNMTLIRIDLQTLEIQMREYADE